MATLEACTKTTTSRKKKQRIFEFKSFGKALVDFCGPFRDNIRLFLEEYGEQIDQQQKNVWTTLLLSESNGAVFPLYVIEERIDDHSVHPFCSHCKSVGWGHHFVCKRRYRFMIQSYGDKQLLKDYDHDSNNNIELDDSLILHGLIHCNGFGHLISINNLQLGSSISLTETDVMNLWDSICNSLKTRKVSVSDCKLERSMELRLIYGVAFKCSWFGNWGYKFGNGSFGVTEDKYKGAVEFLSGLDLEKIMDDFKNTYHGRKIQKITLKYHELSETRLNSLSDLLQCLLEFKLNVEAENGTVAQSRKLLKYKHNAFDEKSENPMSFEEFLDSLMDADCRWSETRVEYLLEVIVKLLKMKNDAMSRYELRESAREFVGDTGLIDFVLKSINVFSYENYIISKVVNLFTKLVEFEIREVAFDSKNVKSLSSLWKKEPRWPKERLERTAKVIVNILKEHKILNNGINGAISRKDLRNVANQYVGDTGLIDYVLKSINNLVIGKQVVIRTRNQLTRLIEFEVRDRNNEEFGVEEEIDVYGDMLFLYRNVLLGYPWWNSVSQACEIILNSKYFVKERESGIGNNGLMTLTCRVLPSFDELETELTRPLPPGELVTVSEWMTIGNLREVAQGALRDTYCIMDSFIVQQIGGLKGMQDEMVLSRAVEPGEQVWVRGSGLDLSSMLRYEGGPGVDGFAMESRVECPRVEAYEI